MFERNSRNANNASNSKNAYDSQDASNNSETTNSINATQATLNSVLSKRKDKRFDIEAYYRNKPKRFDLIRLKSEQIGTFLIAPNCPGIKTKRLYF
jgi:hypothetical protein